LSEQVKQLPIFVYGTLRPGGSLYPQIRPFVARHEPAQMENFVMYSVGMFPVIFQGDGAVQGDLLHIHEDQWGKTIRLLDYIEANGQLYNRTDSYVASTPGKPLVPVWVYLTTTPVSALGPERRVVSNDWFRR